MADYCTGRAALYDIRSDPYETRNLVTQGIVSDEFDRKIRGHFADCANVYHRIPGIEREDQGQGLKYLGLSSEDEAKLTEKLHDLGYLD